MSREKASKKEQISLFGEKVKQFTTDDQKIEFFDHLRKHFL